MIAREPFGRTGHSSSRVILGGVAFAEATQSETDKALELAQSLGVNHVDVASSYGDAEARIGDWIGRHGKPFFLATKIDERTASKARKEFQRSLGRLKVDRLDLLQLHNLVDPGEWETALGPGGALEAAIEAREQGLVDFIGVTGHGVAVAGMHNRSLEHFDFDSVLLPLNFVMAQNEQYFKNLERLVATCQSRNVAVQTIKSIVRSPWGRTRPNHETWYRPLEDQVAIDRAVQWVLGHRRIFMVSVGDVHLLPKVLDAADRFQKAPTDEEMQAQVEELNMQPLFT